MVKKRFVVAVASTLLATGASVPCLHAQDRGHFKEGPIRHVLVISIDGMHAVDFINCSKGLSGVNGGQPYCPNLTALGETGVNHLETSTSKPSDSFPGLTAIVSGGSARTEGVFYDVAYDRSLNPPATMTGNGLNAGPCTPGAAPIGTRTEYEEGIDINQTFLNGIGPSGPDGAGSQLIPPNCLATRTVSPFFPGTSSGLIPFSALSMPLVATLPGPTSIRPTSLSLARETAQTLTIFLVRKSIRSWWPCR